MKKILKFYIEYITFICIYFIIIIHQTLCHDTIQNHSLKLNNQFSRCIKNMIRRERIFHLFTGDLEINLKSMKWGIFLKIMGEFNFPYQLIPKLQFFHFCFQQLSKHLNL